MEPYYIIIFTAIQTENNKSYSEMAELMDILAKQ